MKVQINESQLNNLLTFLDRVELKGIQENQAYMEILSLLDKPIYEDTPSDNNEKNK